MNTQSLVTANSSVPLAILYYDYALMVSTEIERFWKTFTLNWVSFLYVANRFLSLFGHIPVLVIYFYPTISENVRLYYPFNASMTLSH